MPVRSSKQQMHTDIKKPEATGLRLFMPSKQRSGGIYSIRTNYLELIVRARLVILSASLTTRVQLARDGVGHAGQLLLLLLKVLGDGSSGCLIVSINCCHRVGIKGKAYHSPRASPASP